MATIGYLRVSTNETRQHGRAQRKALRDAGAERIYEDQASGSKAYKDRPELSRLLDDLADGDVLIVYALSRATRSLSDLLELVADLDSRGVALKSVTEGQVDTSTPHGKFLVSILGAVAEMELEWTRARVRSGLAAARERGRGPVPTAGWLHTVSGGGRHAGGEHLSRGAQRRGICCDAARAGSD